MINPERDRLIDILLEEELGGQTPPDLTDKILRRTGARLRHRLIAALTFAAAAAVIILGLLGWWETRSTYPLPTAKGGFEVVDGGQVTRGATVRTQRAAADLQLGDYAEVALRPQTQVRIEGTQGDEAVFLERGEVECSVTSGKGLFTVRTTIGTVSVVGTKFQVRVVDEVEGDKMLSKRMVVRVTMGAVLVAGAWGVVQLGGGEEQAFAQEKQKEKNPLEGKKGKVVGSVVSKGENFIEVKGVGEEEARKYVPEWRGGQPNQGGGPDKEILKIFRELKVGSRVEVEWVFHERLRALKVSVLGNAAKKDKE